MDGWKAFERLRLVGEAEDIEGFEEDEWCEESQPTDGRLGSPGTTLANDCNGCRAMAIRVSFTTLQKVAVGWVGSADLGFGWSNCVRLPGSETMAKPEARTTRLFQGWLQYTG